MKGYPLPEWYGDLRGVKYRDELAPATSGRTAFKPNTAVQLTVPPIHYFQHRLLRYSTSHGGYFYFTFDQKRRTCRPVIRVKANTRKY